MENQDIFNQFKKAADNAESPDFASMEKVWNRVEEKLDKKELKKETILWKKWAVAASVLLGLSIGYQFLKSDRPALIDHNAITQKDSVQKVTTPNNAVVAADPHHPAIKQEAGDILNRQLIAAEQVAMADQIGSGNTVSNDSLYYFKTAKVVPMVAEDAEERAPAADKSSPSKDVELFMNKENRVSSAKKEKPLLVYDNVATNKQTVKEVDMDEIESIIELPDPLYIINGVEYTEQELFGPNPTSPYAPLTEQEIDSISILQDEKAISAYGKKGKKGVVIISTKNGKPAAKKRQ